MKRVKILYIIPAEGFGGAERQALFHIRNLATYDVEVSTVTGSGNVVFNQLCNSNIGSVHHCPTMPREYGRAFSFFSFLSYLCGQVISCVRTFIFLTNLIKKEKIDAIFASRAAGWILAGALSWYFRIPTIWRFGSRIHGIFRRFSLRLLAAAFNPTVAVSNCKAVSESIRGLIDAPIVLIPNGIDIREYDKSLASFGFRDNLGIPSGVALVGLAIRPSPDKGMDFLAVVMHHIKNLTKPVHFCIAGEFGWRIKIQEEYKKQNLDGMISFLGHIDDMASFYSSCDIIALTSCERSIEGFPNSLLEAMALGRPVIATDVGGVGELIEHGKTGILIKDMDAAVFASEIVALLENPVSMQCLGRAAQKAVLERYSIEQTVKPLAFQIRATILTNKKSYPIRKSLPIPEAAFD